MAVNPDGTDEQAAALIEAHSEVLKLRSQLKRTVALRGRRHGPVRPQSCRLVHEANAGQGARRDPDGRMAT